VLVDPTAAGELSHDSLVELALATEVDAFDARIQDPKLRLTQVAREACILAGEHLGIDEQREALVEGERGGSFA
jgi:hypothetical protein